MECVIVSTWSAARRLPSLVMGVCISRLPSLLMGVCISNVGRLWLCSSVSSAGTATKSGASRVLGETRREDARIPGLRPRLLRRNSFRAVLAARQAGALRIRVYCKSSTMRTQSAFATFALAFAKTAPHSRKPRVMDVTDARTSRTTPLLDAAIEPPKARRLRLIVTVAVVTLGSSIQSGFATGVVRHAQLQSTHSSNPRTPLRLV